LPVTDASAQAGRYQGLINPEVKSPFRAVADQVMPAVVSITASRTFQHPEIENDNPLEDLFRFYPRGRGMGREFEVPGAGSGFVVSPDGYVLTNNHVINEAGEIEVMLPGENEPYPAEIVGQDPSTDLALLKIDPKGRELSHLEFGDSDEIGVGDWAIAIGNPLGQLAGSLTVGVISAKGRSDLNIQGGSPRYQDFLQTDAAINFGNSGGPLVDIHGRVIGVNTAINASGQNIGFTIPINLAARIYEQLRENGRVIRGYLGVRMRSLTPEIAAGRDMEITHGVIVEEVVPGTPAERGGVEVGDIIVEFNGEPIEQDRDLQFKVAESEVGSEAEVVVFRDGDHRTLTVVLEEFREDAVLASAPTGSGDRSVAEGETWLGITAKSLDETGDDRVEELREAFDIREDRGVLVVDVEPGSAAERGRLRAGDVIVEIVNTPVEDLEDFSAAARRYRERTKPIALLIRRGEMTSYITIDPTED
jgi:serine protease Do